MAETRGKGVLLDVDYTQDGNESAIRLYFKTDKGKLALKDRKFRPYFYIKVDSPDSRKKELLEKNFNGIKIKGIEVEDKSPAPGKKPEKFLKLFFSSTQDLKNARDLIAQESFVSERREFDIPFAKRYLIDRQLEPMNLFEFSFDEEKNLLDIKELGEAPLDFRLGSFDLEMYAPGRFAAPDKDPIIMASFVDSTEQSVFSTKKIDRNYWVKVNDEKELIEKVCAKFSEKDIDIVVTYNGDGFDFPYIKSRAEKLGTKAGIGVNGTAPKIRNMGKDLAAVVKGRPHIDAYQVTRILNRFGVINLIKFDIESVSEKLFGKKKDKVTPEEINSAWEAGILERLADYNKEDSEAAYKIVDQYLPLFIEMSRLVKQGIWDVSRGSASMLVEYLLINKSFQKNVLIPNNPDDALIKQRFLQPIEGGFVKMPIPGLHENLAFLDFSSLHPTIMISHNISPDSLDCEHSKCREKNSSPTGHHFCMKEKGFISSIIEEIFHKRIELKNSLKGMDKNSDKYRLTYARQYSLKILLNSFYGTLAYPRFRWYSRECGRAVTAWSREYVQWVAKKADAAGFETIYGDTDSALLKLPAGKMQDDVKKFVEGINKELPGVMNLELEGFYRRGIFVTKKSGEGAAKKKYALIDYNGNLKIVGFEYVRRDWAGIAKNTQRDVIQAVLSEGNPEKAVQIVKDNIERLRQGAAQKNELVIYTQIKKAMDKYESVGPHIAAAKKAIDLGKNLEIGSVIGYIITRSGKSISDRSQLMEFVQEGNYDPDYYIKHQLIPAVIKILRELGYEEEDLIHGGKQHTLGSWG